MRHLLTFPVSNWRMGCAERVQARWATAETHRETDVLDLQGRDIEEPVADEVYVCLADVGHGEDRDSSGIPRATEPFVGRSADGSTRAERTTPPVAGLSAESWSRDTLAVGGLPAYLQGCQNLRSAYVFRGRGGRPVGRAFRNDLKNHILGRKVITGPRQMKRTVLGRLRWMQKTPMHVASFFHSPETKYAA
jgi:hypothetical protein